MLYDRLLQRLLFVLVIWNITDEVSILLMRARMMIYDITASTATGVAATVVRILLRHLVVIRIIACVLVACRLGQSLLLVLLVDVVTAILLVV